MATGAYRDKRFRSVALSGIEIQSGWLVKSSSTLTSYVEMLSDRPTYETKAEAGMEEAEIALRASLEIVVKARESYRKLKKDE